jgi:ELWxxDGT repeat protein
LFFTAADGVHGKELWKSDGSRAGTVLVKDIHPGAFGAGGEYPSELTGVAGKLFFASDDGVRGRELWKSDGRRADTVLVKDINAVCSFDVASQGTPVTRTGALRLKVTVADAGRLVVEPAEGSPVQRSVKDVASPGSTKITLTPTETGMRILKQVGKLEVKARFTFTPFDQTGSSVIHRYTLTLR